MFADLRSAFRLLRKHPILSLGAILSLALGIGANATIFTYANALLLGAPPIGQSHRVVELWTYSRLPGLPFNGYLPVSFPDFQDWSRQNRTLTGIAVYSPFTEANWNRNGEIRPLQGQVVSADYFSVLQVRPMLGRGFTPAEGETGARPVIVIGYALWQKAMGGERDVLGQTMRLDGHDFTIVGVAPRGFLGLFAGLAAEYFVPPSQAAVVGFAGGSGGGGGLTSRNNHNWMAVARLKPGTTAAAAQAELSAIARHLDRLYPKGELKDSVVRVATLGAVPFAFRQPVAGVVALLAIIVALVLLIACANAANLLLVQAQGRRREVAIRGALGASRGRLVRQALTESVVLAILAGAAGLWIADWLAPLILKLAPQGGPSQPATLIAVGWPVVIFTFALALVTGLISGLAPALRGSRAAMVQELRDGTAGAGYARSRLRNILVVGEIAVCMLVLAGAGLCLRSLQHAHSIDPGFDAAHLLIAQEISPQIVGYKDARATAFMDDVAQRVRALPGITNVSWIENPPLQGGESDTDLKFPGMQPPPGQPGFDVQLFRVGPGYFAAMGTPIVAGRGFGEQDLPRAKQLIVINEAFARRFFPGQNPIGKEVDHADGSGKMTIIGLVPTGKYRTLGEAPRAVFFELVDFNTAATLVARATAAPAALLATFRRTLTDVDPNLPADAVETGEQYMTVPLLVSHLTAVLLGGFAVLALILALVGLYGVVAFSVCLRTREFGIRLALGARAGNVARLVLGQGIKLAVIGVAVGLVLSMFLLRALTAVLYGISATDPGTLAAVALVLVAMAALASYWPARRATRVAPLVALRSE